MNALSQGEGRETRPAFVERLATLASSLVPDAFSIAIILTFATLLAAVTWAGASPSVAVRAWGQGIWTLLPLSMQIAMAYSYGDMATNLIQPFWAIPLLGLAKLEFKHILGYELVFFAVYSTLVVGALRFI